MRFWIVAMLLIDETCPLHQKNSQPLAAFLGHVKLYVVMTDALARKWGVLFTCGTQFSFKHFPSHSNWICKLWPIGTVLHRLCADRVHGVCKNTGAFQHFRSFGTVKQESCYGCKKWNYQKLHYVMVFSSAVLYNP